MFAIRSSSLAGYCGSVVSRRARHVDVDGGKPRCAVGASGNPVTFSIDPSSTSGACSLTGSTVSFTGIGTCVIDAGQAGNNSYTAAPQVQQTFTIGPAPLTVTASSGTIAAGSQVPAVTAAYTGWVNGDTAASAITKAPACTTSATSSSPVGSYGTSCSGGTFSANYAPQYVGIRPDGEPEVQAIPLTPASVADATEEMFRERVRWWGG